MTLKPLCIIVGFGAGVGAGVAKAFGSAGFALALISRTPEKTANLVAELRQEGFSVEAYAANAGSHEQLTSTLSEAQLKQGPVSVLVYNAIAPTFVMPTQLTPQQITDDFKVNVAGALASVLAVLPALKTAGSGSILFTGGGWAHYPQAFASSPSIGKAGLRSLAFTLGEELQGSGIKVGLVSIMGGVERGTDFDPDRIGQAFLKVHQLPLEGFKVEHQYSGPTF